MSRRPPRSSRSSLAVFVAKRIHELQHLRSQREIAIAAGLPSVNLLSMIKRGDAKLPLERVADLARALDIDETQLMALAVRQFFAPGVVDLLGHALNPASDDGGVPAVDPKGVASGPDKLKVTELSATVVALRVEAGRTRYSLANARRLLEGARTRLEHAENSNAVLVRELDALASRLH